MVGIGNPGDRYRDTRHNVGFMTLDLLAARTGAEFRRERFWNADRARCRIGGEEASLVKPLSYVNLSGPVVRKVMDDLEIGCADLLVVLDDFWLPLGRLRVRKKGGGGGHNGLESVVRALRTEEVQRLRVGIGAPRPGNAVDHVLSRFRADERPVLDDVLGRAADAVLVWATDGPDTAMNRYNQAPEESSGGEATFPEG